MRKLTKKQRGFAEDYLETGNGTLAAKNNYDIQGKDKDKIASVIAVENLGKPSIQEYLTDKATHAAEIIYTIAQFGESDRDRLTASRDILDRAGYKAIEKSITINVEATPSDKVKALADGLKELHRGGDTTSS